MLVDVFNLIYVALSRLSTVAGSVFSAYIDLGVPLEKLVTIPTVPASIPISRMPIMLEINEPTRGRAPCHARRHQPYYHLPAIGYRKSRIKKEGEHYRWL